jgi:CubicO group peptidase (beta-lactamase class C family)
MLKRFQPLLVVAVVFVLASGLLAQRVQPSAAYFPPRHDWARQTPEAAGFDATKLKAAIDFAIENRNTNTRDMSVDVPNSFRREAPYNALIGPTSTRADANGLIIRGGKIVAEWGDTSRPDMTFSVTKTFLSTVVGLAYDRGMIRDLNDRVAGYMPANVDLFATEKNAPITWDHLLRQTSDWSGTLWGKPDWADRPVGQTEEQWKNRPVFEPGKNFKYNDVRVNVLALATLHVWRESLPKVLRREIMEPIGASSTWRWEGYDNSWIDLDGEKVQASTGGGHFGGGMFISAFDLGRFGYLYLRNGKWADRQLVSTKWIGLARTPGTANPEYGFMNWYLNNGRKAMPSVPENTVRFVGNGNNIVYLDWDNDLVVVVRWIRGGRPLEDFFAKVVGALARKPQAVNRKPV